MKAVAWFGLTLLGVAGFGLASKRKRPPGPPDPTRGYQLPGCAQVVIENEATALAWAREMGKKTPTADMAQVLFDGCATEALPPGMRPQADFLYRLIREALRGRVESEGLSTFLADTVLSQIRQALQSQGINTSDPTAWPPSVGGT